MHRTIEHQSDFVTQIRLGLNSKQFHIAKFCSMYVRNDHGNVLQAAQDDSRTSQDFKQFLHRTGTDA